MEPIAFSATLVQDRDSNWHYVHVPKSIRDSLKSFERRGSIKVQATVGYQTWDGSLLPWADGSAQLSIKQTIRQSQHLQPGDQLIVIIQPL
jgi:hypothetical protein